MPSTSSIVLGLAAAGLAVAQSAGCGGAGIASGTYSVQINGQNREYTLRVPDNYDSSTPLRLIFGYHWLGGSMQNVVQGSYYGLEPLAQGSAVFVAPQGLDAGWANSGGQDIAFTDAILETVLGGLCIDESQIFATGFSYGGGMSFSVACARPDVFRAVAPIAGAQLSGCDGGNTPIAYLGIHGVVDSVLPIDAGRQLRDKFVGLNGCSAEQAAEPSPGSGSHMKTEYSCSGPPVWWIAHSGDHVADPRDGDGTLWAPGETWDFFTNVA
ncbi:Alpha/Beta hydrolase protein [Stachybotrys elegans]|uniref:Feruloyl esterase C n=1 Tax=Stachybotrys elegans TaxID=80388 RepID=A0A8K0SML7_9HYPO|nr:Alpha/Beta hydrolase protein [Stachybotrys elegans]